MSIDTLTFAWVGTAALVMTIMCFNRSFAGKGASMEAIAGVMAATLWGVYGITGFDLVVYTGGSGTEVTVESLGIMAVVFAAVMVLFSFQALRGVLREPSEFEEVT